jgi:hypothetical protein
MENSTFVSVLGNMDSHDQVNYPCECVFAFVSPVLVQSHFAFIYALHMHVCLDGCITYVHLSAHIGFCKTLGN